MVGQVILMQQHTTNHIYSIDDGSGRVEVRHWVGASGNTEAEMEKWSGIESVLPISPSGQHRLPISKGGNLRPTEWIYEVVREQEIRQSLLYATYH